MHWYIKKVSSISLAGSNTLTLVQGDPVKEDQPARFEKYTRSMVSDGPPSRLWSEIVVCEDPEDKGAPVYRHSGMWYAELRHYDADNRWQVSGNLYDSRPICHVYPRRLLTEALGRMARIIIVATSALR